METLRLFETRLIGKLRKLYNLLYNHFLQQTKFKAEEYVMPQENGDIFYLDTVCCLGQ